MSSIDDCESMEGVLWEIGRILERIEEHLRRIAERVDLNEVVPSDGGD